MPPTTRKLASALVATALACAAIGAGTWWLTRGPRPRITPPTARATAISESEAIGAAVAADPNDAGRLDPMASLGARLEVAPTIAADVPDALAALPLEAAPTEGVELRIIDAARVAVAGAAIVTLSVAENDNDLPPTLLDPEALARGGARRWRSDTEGRCRVPFALDSRRVLAFTAGARGTLILDPTVYFPIELMVKPCFVVEVEVVDGAGVPQAGLEVGFSRAKQSLIESTVRALTDPHGRCRFTDLDLVLLTTRAPRLSIDGPAPEEKREEWRVALCGLAGEAAQQTIELPPATPTATVRLVAADHGSLAIRVVAAPETPLPPKSSVLIRMSGAGDRRLDGAVPLDEAGRASVAPLELGASGFVELRADGFAATRTPILGPRRSAERVEIELVAEANGFWVVGRAVDANGAPIASRNLSGEFEHNDFETPLDADGRFRIDLTNEYDEATVNAELRLVAGDDPKGQAPRPRRAPLDANVKLQCAPRGTDDLGDVSFREQRLIVAGHVVDGQGAPVAAAFVAVHGATPAGGDASSFSDAEGAFAIYGRFPAGPCSVSASRRGLIVANVRDVALGTVDLRLELVAGGACEGSLRADGPLAPNWFLAALVPAGSHERVKAVVPTKEGRLRFPLLPAVPHDFVLSFASDPERRELLRWTGIEVRPHELTCDPRLIDLDPANWIATSELHVHLPDGAPAPEGQLLVDPDTRKPKGQLALVDGIAVAPFFGDQVRFTLLVPGWRSISGQQRAGRQDLTLEPPLQATVVVGGIAPRDDGLVVTGLEARPQSTALRRLGAIARGALNEGVAELALPAYGKYELLLQLMRRAPDGTWQPDPKGTREVRAGSIDFKQNGPQRFEVKVK